MTDVSIINQVNNKEEQRMGNNDTTVGVTARQVAAPEGHWAWPEGAGTQVLRVGQTIYIGGQVSLSRRGEVRDAGNVEAQTSNVFSSLVSLLGAAGATMNDLVKLHTYYVFEGEGRDVTAYWERMTKVRLRYLANPGPAATALRVSGAPFPSALISIDGVALVDVPKQRIMPKHTWDWSIPTPFSQGWRAGNKVYVGGQISADMSGKALAIDDAVQQTRNILELIRHVLLDGGADRDDLVTLRVCYQHAEGQAGVTLRDPIMRTVAEVLPNPGPTITAFGGDLLYEGLLLEIDALAVCDDNRRPIRTKQDPDLSPCRFPAGWQVGPETHFCVAGTPDGAAEDQLAGVLGEIRAILAEAKADPAHLVKLTAFYIADGDVEKVARTLRLGIRGEFPAPVVTLVQVASLPEAGQRLQIEGVCIAPRT
jgi:enamine deaminase RidA (YjgF/YER057c/UK114 family)